jgi:hypothetical protein
MHCSATVALSASGQFSVPEDPFLPMRRACPLTLKWGVTGGQKSAKGKDVRRLGDDAIAW